MMHPICYLRQKCKPWQLPFLTRWIYLFFIICIYIIHCSRYYCARISHPNNLAFKQMCLFSRKMRVCKYLSIQIASKKIFNFTGYHHLSRCDSWQLFPLSIQIRTHPISVFIYSCSFRLNIRWQFFLSRICWTLCDIIISIASYNLSPEFKLFYLFGD